MRTYSPDPCSWARPTPSTSTTAPACSRTAAIESGHPQREACPTPAFGTGWLDVDNDGWLDLLVRERARLVRILDELAAAGRSRTRCTSSATSFFRNLGDGPLRGGNRREAGAVIRPRRQVSRGAAFGDVDNDGDTDVLIANADGRPRLLVNTVGAGNHWLGLRLVGRAAPRDMVGARVAVTRGDGSTLWRRARADGSYASAQRSPGSRRPRRLGRRNPRPRLLAERSRRGMDGPSGRPLHDAHRGRRTGGAGRRLSGHCAGSRPIGAGRGRPESCIVAEGSNP